MITRGRFAPSPTGELHLGNLRTAVLAHDLATSHDGDFIIRMEDLDQMTSGKRWSMRQLLDLSAVGVNSDREVVYQSKRFDLYREFIQILKVRGLTYQCFCSRKDVAESVVAPHDGIQIYGGKCRELSRSQQEDLMLQRPSALRLRVDDEMRARGVVNDIVLVRNDGIPAYNLAVVVDDEVQGVTQVVRGEDLESITPSQKYLQRLLGFRELQYVHLPLMVGPDGQRLAKRHGAVTLGDCLEIGFSASAVRRALLNSIRVGTNGWGPSSSLAEWLRSLL